MRGYEQQQQQYYKQHQGKQEQVSKTQKEKNRNVALLMIGVIIAAIGLAYASAPLYRMFCQATGYGGTVRIASGHSNASALDESQIRNDRPLVITFQAEVGADLEWSFKPLQRDLKFFPGENVLTFFQATNHTSKPIIGVSTYNVTPMKIGRYFNKVQCFCFEEQQLQPGETVDMPVLFFVDPQFCEDKRLKTVNELTLAYTFFKVKEGENSYELQRRLQDELEEKMIAEEEAKEQ